MGHVRKFGPFYLMLIATFLVMLDPMRHVLMDAVEWSLVDEKTGKLSNFHFGPCEYEIQEVKQGKGGVCPDKGKGPFLVDKENTFGVDMPMYAPGGGLSVYGFWITVVATWSGFALMIFSIFWVTDLPRKLWRQYQALRRPTAGNRAPLLRG